ncbi:MAG TPA: alpha/beta hydrolase [Pyrinomonadaceae bacterium]|nr:alpha/beta hydrolase [Pyrinomonadaceae bacterium]
MLFTDSYRALRRGERALAVRYLVISVLIIGLIGAPVGFFMLRRFEASVIFHPERAARAGVWRAPRGAEEVWFGNAEGLKLHGWFFRSPTQPARATVLYAHGNGGNLSYCEWVGESLAARGFDVLLFDYRGYGRSEGEPAGEAGLYADTEAAYDFLTKERGVAARQLVLYGQSLGTAAVADVAARRECGGLVLESGLTSAADMAAVIMPWLPRFVRRLTKNKLDTVSKLPRVRCPVLVAHGDRDEIIPASQGRKLFEAANEPKRLLIVEGAGHNDLSNVGGEKYIDTLAEFVGTSLRPER